MTNTTVTSVEITRAEGPTALCDQKQSFQTIEQAEAWLRKSAATCPATGGYDKHDFTVYFSDGDSYNGRIDLQRQHTSGYDIRAHILDFVGFLAGTKRPAHMTSVQYAAVRKQYASYESSSLAFLAKYDHILNPKAQTPQADFLAWAGC